MPTECVSRRAPVIVGWAMPTEWVTVRRRLPRSWRSHEARADCAGSSSPRRVGNAHGMRYSTRPGVRTRRITVLHRIVVNVIEKRLKLARFVDRLLPEPPLPYSALRGQCPPYCLPREPAASIPSQRRGFHSALRWEHWWAVPPYAYSAGARSSGESPRVCGQLKRHGCLRTGKGCRGRASQPAGPLSTTAK
jgi:hypothetical protein